MTYTERFHRLLKTVFTSLLVILLLTLVATLAITPYALAFGTVAILLLMVYIIYIVGGIVSEADSRLAPA